MTESEVHDFLRYAVPQVEKEQDFPSFHTSRTIRTKESTNHLYELTGLAASRGNVAISYPVWAEICNMFLGTLDAFKGLHACGICFLSKFLSATALQQCQVDY